MIFVLLGVACGGGPWTPTRALSPALARLDADHDGRVVAEEYARVDFSGPKFVEADTDGDGALSMGELRTLTFSQDPTTFYDPPPVAMGNGDEVPGSGGNNPRKPGGPDRPGGPMAGGGGEGPPGGKGGPGGPMGPGGPGGKGGAGGGREAAGGGGPADRLHPPDALLVLEILIEEVRSVDPTIPLPDDARVERVGRAGALDSEEAKALLVEIEAASDRAKLDFPASLRARPRGGPALAPPIPGAIDSPPEGSPALAPALPDSDTSPVSPGGRPALGPPLSDADAKRRDGAGAPAPNRNGAGAQRPKRDPADPGPSRPAPP